MTEQRTNGFLGYTAVLFIRIDNGIVIAELTIEYRYEYRYKNSSKNSI